MMKLRCASSDWIQKYNCEQMERNVKESTIT